MLVLVPRLVHVEVEVVVEGVVAVDGVEVVVPVVGDVVVVGGDGRCRWQQARGHPWGRWRRRVCLSCRRWVAGSSLLLPEHFQRFPDDRPFIVLTETKSIPWAPACVGAEGL